MKSRWMNIFSLLVVPAVTLAVYAADVKYEKGETWTYEVKGPRIWSQDDVSGDRTIKITSAGEERFTAEETWGTYDDNPLRLTINKEGKQSKLEVGDAFEMEYATPVPFQFLDLLAVDEEKDFGKNTTESEMFTISLATKVKREKDEDVTVPAGEFKGCQRYTVTNIIAFEGGQGEIAREMTRQLWVHKDANGIVKDVYEFQPMGPDAGDSKVKGESVLKKHEVAKTE